MRRMYKVLMFFLILLIGLVSCRKENFSAYYDRPDWLPQPIYQQLQSGQYGDFKLFLSLIDKTGYNKVLDRAGYFTIFAPTDSAFQAFLNENYGGSINNIDTISAKKIVTFSLVYNAFKKERLDDYQNTATGWDPNNSFKKRTVYYKGVYKDPSLPAPYNSYLLIDNNIKPALTITNLAYNINDNGNKYIPFFTQDYFTNKGLTSFDYNYFFPETPFTGFNIVDAKVLQTDIAAENGIIHVVNKVIKPLPNIDEYLTSKPDQYSRFKSILDSFVYLFTSSTQMATKYQKVTSVYQDVYVKRIPPNPSTPSTTPVFAPNNENWNVDKANDTQTDGWVLFAPNNEALNDFLTNKFCKYYGSLSRMVSMSRQQIIYDFINSLMSDKTIWPSQLSTLNNYLGEKVSDIQNNIVDKKVLSNGLFYGTNKVHQSGLFYSVFGELYLNPRYSMMTNLINLGGYRDLIINQYTKYTIFMIPDEIFNRSGFTYNPVADPANPWYGTNDAGVYVHNSDIYNKLLRMVKLCILKTDNGELDDLSGQGIVKGIGDECIRFKNNVIYASGNIDSLGVVKRVVNVLPVVASPNNGKVYEVDSLPRYTTLGIRNFIGGNPNYSNFYALLKKSTLFKGLDILLGNSENMILIPDNAVLAADPIFASTDAAKIDLFIKYHIVPKKSFIGDGAEAGSVATYLTVGAEPNRVTVINTKNSITITDEVGNTANVINDFSRSYVLANKTIIHQIDKVLAYLIK